MDDRGELAWPEPFAPRFGLAQLGRGELLDRPVGERSLKEQVLEIVGVDDPPALKRDPEGVGEVVLRGGLPRAGWPGEQQRLAVAGDVGPGFAPLLE